jgi:SAM-dependent methyltransferase
VSQDQPKSFSQAVEHTIATYDRVAANYAERNESQLPEWQEHMARFLDALSESAPLAEIGRPGDDISLEDYLQFIPVLDAGCGAGRDARALAASGTPVLAIDLSQGMLDEAISRTARRLPQGSIRYALMDLRRLELPEACCRGVWCSASLLHLPPAVAPRAVAQLARVARPGAPVTVLLKRRYGDLVEHMERYQYSQPADLPDPERYFAYYTTEEARALLEDAGLRVREALSMDVSGKGFHRWVVLHATKP